MKRRILLLAALCLAVIVHICAAEPFPQQEEKAVPAADAEKSGDDSGDNGFILYGLPEENLFDSFAFAQLNTTGKTTWTAPLAGIEFAVPDSFSSVKGNIRASAGMELCPGSDMVTLGVKYIPAAKEDYMAMVCELGRLDCESASDDEIAKAIETYENYYNSVANLFTVAGIGNNGGMDEIKQVYREYYEDRCGMSPEETQTILDGMVFIPAGSADGYNFFLVKSENDEGNAFNETNQEYKDEYDELCSNLGEYAERCTFQKPLTVADFAGTEAGLLFETVDLNGNSVSSTELFGKHKVTMVNIWSTSCSACLSEMPDLNRLSTEFSQKGGQLVGLVYDAEEEDQIEEAREIAEDLNLNFVNILPNNEITSSLNIQAFPATYFVDENGEFIGEPLVGRQVGQYSALMDQYLNE